MDILWGTNTFDRVLYSDQLVKGIVLPNKLLPNIDDCQHGCNLDKESLVLANTGIIIYTRNEVLKYNEHKGMIFLCMLS